MEKLFEGTSSLPSFPSLEAVNVAFTILWIGFEEIRLNTDGIHRWRGWFWRFRIGPIKVSMHCTDKDFRRIRHFAPTIVRRFLRNFSGRVVSVLRIFNISKQKASFMRDKAGVNPWDIVSVHVSDRWVAIG